MKQITYLEWNGRFEIIADADDAASELGDNPDSFTFYDNGSVKRNADSDFVVKMDNVREVV